MSGIVWLASYPKSGNTWLRIFLANYLYPSPEGADINSLPIRISAADRKLFDSVVGLESSDLTLDEVDLLRPEFYRRLAATSTESLFIKTHDAFATAPDENSLLPADVTGGAVYIVRNPLDVAVSFAHHLSRPVDEIIDCMGDPHFAFGLFADRLHHSLRQKILTWSGHTGSWLDQKTITLHLMRYEDMLERPTDTFASCLRFLGLDCDASRIRTALAQSAFDFLRSREAIEGFHERTRADQRFFRSGKAGQWQNELLPEQVRRIREQHGPMMARLGYC